MLISALSNQIDTVMTERALGRLTVQDYGLAIIWTRVAGSGTHMFSNAKPERSV